MELLKIIFVCIAILDVLVFIPLSVAINFFESAMVELLFLDMKNWEETLWLERKFPRLRMSLIRLWWGSFLLLGLSLVSCALLGV